MILRYDHRIQVQYNWNKPPPGRVLLLFLKIRNRIHLGYSIVEVFDHHPTIEHPRVGYLFGTFKLPGEVC